MQGAKKKAKPEQWRAPNLTGKVAVVTGASRGAGRGIASVLGECGARVYVVGRSVRGVPTTDNMPGTIEDTADEVTRRGGRGLAVRCDCTVNEEVKALFERVKQEQGRLDLLVNNAWGGYEGGPLMPKRFWNILFEKHWQGMFVAGLRAHLLASYYAIPLMLPQKRGLLVSTVAWDHEKYIGNVYDISKHAIVRMMWGLARELRKFRIAAVAIAPGFMRTERVLAAYKTDEQNWRKIPGLKRTETPEYLGRAIACLAADRRAMQKTGRAFHAGELARIYRITDLDGRRIPPFIVPSNIERMLEKFEEKKDWSS